MTSKKKMTKKNAFRGSQSYVIAVVEKETDNIADRDEHLAEKRSALELLKLKFWDFQTKEDHYWQIAQSLYNSGLH